MFYKYLYLPVPRDNIIICSGKEYVIGLEKCNFSVTYTGSSEFSVFFAACALGIFVDHDCERDELSHGSQDTCA